MTERTLTAEPEVTEAKPHVVELTFQMVEVISEAVWEVIRVRRDFADCVNQTSSYNPTYVEAYRRGHFDLIDDVRADIATLTKWREEAKHAMLICKRCEGPNLRFPRQGEVKLFGNVVYAMMDAMGVK